MVSIVFNSKSISKKIESLLERIKIKLLFLKVYPIININRNNYLIKKFSKKLKSLNKVIYYF